jgi:hypothetical protein
MMANNGHYNIKGGFSYFSLGGGAKNSGGGGDDHLQGRIQDF